MQVRDDDAKWILEGGGQPGRFRPTANGEHVRDQAANKARGDWGQYWPDITFFLITGHVGYQKEFEKLNPPVISLIGKKLALKYPPWELLVTLFQYRVGYEVLKMNFEFWIYFISVVNMFGI